MVESLRLTHCSSPLLTAEKQAPSLRLDHHTRGQGEECLHSSLSDFFRDQSPGDLPDGLIAPLLGLEQAMLGLEQSVL